MAVPADINDPLLKKWIKPTTNPFLVQVRVCVGTVNMGCVLGGADEAAVRAAWQQQTC